MAGEPVAQDQLQSYVRRIESVEDQIKAFNDDKSEIYKEARSNGFDVKVLRKVIAARRMDAEERREQGEIFELYWDAVHGVRAHVDAHVREAHLLAAEQKREPVDWDEVSRREYPDDSPVQVYFIAAPSLGLIKIGSTGMVDRRVSAIKRATPAPTALIGVMAGGTKREVELHQKYAAHRVHGEWFADVIRPEIDLLLTGQSIIDEFPVEIPSFVAFTSSGQEHRYDADTAAHDADGVFHDDETPEPQPETAVQMQTGRNQSKASPDRAESIADGRSNSVANTLGDAGFIDPIEYEAETNSQPTPSVATGEHVPTLTVLSRTTESNVTPLRAPKPIRPNCMNRDKCGASGPSECWSCTKAATQRGGAA